jgi:hypothetical protein
MSSSTNCRITRVMLRMVPTMMRIIRTIEMTEMAAILIKKFRSSRSFFVPIAVWSVMTEFLKASRSIEINRPNCSRVWVDS